MSIQTIRKSILIAATAGLIAVAGLTAGRLSAGAFPHHGRGEFVPRLFAHISRALDLTDDQKVKIKVVLKSHADEIKTQLQASAAARQTLHDAVMAQPADENAIRAAAQQVGLTQGDGAILLAKIRREVEPILTSEQKEKVQTFQQKTRERGSAAVRSFDNFIKSN
jgi:Spy/CpxP family protein refolding chaperone